MIYTTIKNILSEKTTDPSSFSFEYKQVEVSIIKDDKDNYYMRVYLKCCVAEGNGRPVTSVNDCCYPIDKEANIDETNWKSYKSYFDCIQLGSSSYEGVG